MNSVLSILQACYEVYERFTVSTYFGHNSSAMSAECKQHVASSYYIADQRVPCLLCCVPPEWYLRDLKKHFVSPKPTEWLVSPSERSADQHRRVVLSDRA